MFYQVKKKKKIIFFMNFNLFNFLFLALNRNDAGSSDFVFDAELSVTWSSTVQGPTSSPNPMPQPFPTVLLFYEFATKNIEIYLFF